MQEIRSYQIKDKEAVPRPNFLGMEMCWKCYAFLHGVGITTVTDLKERAKELSAGGSDEKWVHQGTRQSFHPAPARDAVVKFIKNLEETLGEADPTHKGYVQLPVDTKANHYVDFVAAEAREEGCHCVYDYFCRIWRQHFPKLILPQSMRWVSLVS